MRSIVETRFRAGAWNMAVDCAIADAVAAGNQPPTLRLYGWQPHCLSLGYGQRLRDVARAALQDRGWDLVRRPTGGKAILHARELTYSLCLPLDHPLAAGDVIESYRRISVGLLRALNLLGAPASARHQGAEHSGAQAGPVCFELSSHYEITVAGRKLVGSAQLRRKGMLLQHGSLPLTGDVARICDVLVFAAAEERAEQVERIRQRAITLADAIGREPSWREAAQAFEAGFAEVSDMTLARGQLSASECASAELHHRERFGDPAFTAKR